MKVVSCPTLNYHGYNVKFSPFVPDFVATAASQNYGLAGKGALLIFRQIPDEGCILTVKREWHDGLFDLSWSSFDPNFLATCSGDGTVQIWNAFDSKVAPTVLAGHTKEIYSVHWSPRINNEYILTASADCSIKMWDACTGVECDTFMSHTNIVYGAVWSPHAPGIFASVSGDSNLMLWDIRSPELLPQVIPAHNGDALSCDWNLLNEHVIATGGIDNAINVWDLRNPDAPISTLLGHELSIRRVKFSPFHRNVLASVSYDFSTRLWDWCMSKLLDTYVYHTEFVYGLDFSPHIFDKMCDCGWDSLIQIYEEMEFDFGR